MEVVRWPLTEVRLYHFGTQGKSFGNRMLKSYNKFYWKLNKNIILIAKTKIKQFSLIHLIVHSSFID